MIELIEHVVKPIVQHPDEVTVQIVEQGEAAVLLELRVHPDDRDRVEGERGRTIRAVRNVLSAAAGRRKASLDLVDELAASDSEE